MAPRYKTDTWSGLILAILLTMSDIVQTWTSLVVAWSRREPVKDTLLNRIKTATTYEGWLEAADALDSLPNAYRWRVNPIDSRYDFRLLEERRRNLYFKRRDDDIPELTSYLRHGLFRNMYGITKLGLYDRTYASTKENIHLYVDATVDSIDTIARSATNEITRDGKLSAQELIDNIHDARQTFGHSALMLQGGSIFDLCHLGVVKALLHEDCLPRVIVGTATGALMAALVGIHTREELPELLSGEGLDLSAFAASSSEAKRGNAEELELIGKDAPTGILPNWLHILGRRIERLAMEGFLLDPDVLNECIKANVGDITFAEAYQRTGCILNIVVSPPTEEIPSLMNHLTAPNVLVRSAAMISHVTNIVYQKSRTPIYLLSKDPDGNIETIIITTPSHETIPSSQRTGPRLARDHPTRRLRQQFNVEHFIICQARPYLAPFIQPSLPYVRGQDRSWLPRLFTGLLKHSLQLADMFGILPANISRILSDERIQGDKFTLVPELTLTDWRRMLKNPSKEEVDFWILKGERCVWPSLCALKVRMAVENALAEAWVLVSRKKGGATGVEASLADKEALIALPPQPAYMADEVDTGQRNRRKSGAPHGS